MPRLGAKFPTILMARSCGASGCSTMCLAGMVTSQEIPAAGI